MNILTFKEIGVTGESEIKIFFFFYAVGFKWLLKGIEIVHYHPHYFKFISQKKLNTIKTDQIQRTLNEIN